MSSMSLKKHLALVLLVLFFVPIELFFIFGALLLLPAGDPLFIGLLSTVIPLTTDQTFWLEGWLYILTFGGIMYVFYLYIAIKDPQTILNRGKMSADLKEILLMIVLTISFLLLIVLPGLNRQYFSEFYRLDFPITIVGVIGVAIGTFIIILANWENTYASKGVTIHEGQQVISTGPYAVVRHPLYTGGVIMFLSTPIALGSLIAFIPSIVCVIMILSRIRWEEALLHKELPGYTEYTQKVKYKIIPKVY